MRGIGTAMAKTKLTHSRFELEGQQIYQVEISEERTQVGIMQVETDCAHSASAANQPPEHSRIN